MATTSAERARDAAGVLRAGAAEQQRRAQAAHGAPAREDHQRDSRDALPAGQALVPASGIVERQEGTAYAGEGAADRRRQQADAGHRCADGEGGVDALALPTDGRVRFSRFLTPPKNDDFFDQFFHDFSSYDVIINFYDQLF